MGARRKTIYGPRWFNNEVVSVDVDTGNIRKEASGFNVPAAVKFNSKGELFVLDTGAGKVVKVLDGKNSDYAFIENGLDNSKLLTKMNCLFLVILKAMY